MNSRDLAEIFGQSQWLTAVWTIQGGIIFPNRRGKKLQIDNTEGITLRDIYGNLEFQLGFDEIYLLSIPTYANNAAAVAAGLAIGRVYRTGGDPDTIAVVH